MKRKNTILIFLSLMLCLTSSLVYAEDNANTGGGNTKPAVVGKYRSSEWMYKVSIYVGLSDKADTFSSMKNFKLIGEPVYWRADFPMPSNTHFTKHNKIDYLQNGVNLTTYKNEIYIVDKDVPRIPVTHHGNLKTVKSFFGDTNTLIKQLDKLGAEYGKSKEDLVRNITFNINGKNTKQDPSNILPMKNAKGKYQNLVPWVVVYEPVGIAHLSDKQTRLAFTATEFALAQKTGLFNFFYSGKNAQWIANFTHANLPNSVVLENDWFGFKAYKPLATNKKWTDDRIIQGGGWGMRILMPNAVYEEPPKEDDDNNHNTGGNNGPGGTLTEPDNISIGDYRTDTDVVTSFWIYSDEEINPSSPANVGFYVDGQRVASQRVVLPKGGSQVVWFKWHTPKKPTTVTVQAQTSKGQMQGSTSKKFKIVDLQAYEPPDPRAKDSRTGKVVTKPNWFKKQRPRKEESKTSNEWSVWTAEWNENFVWVSTGEDEGYWNDDGWWIYYKNNYSASVRMTNYDIELKPDDKVPTAKKSGDKWRIKSGYGWNLDTKIRLTTTDGNSVARQGNTITYLPEYNYKGYLRLSDRMDNLEFKLKKNRYSTYNQRVHFTPLWYPDDEYNIYTRIMDIWTPAGHLYINKESDMRIKGSVLDDYKAVPSKVDRYK